MTLSALALMTSLRRAIELEIDGGDQRAVFVARRDESSVDLAGIGAVGVTADDDVDRLVELLHNIDDRSGNTRAFIVVAGGEAALMDQHHDGLNALGLQFGHQRVDGVRFIPEFETGNAGRRHEAGRAFQRQADEGDGNAVECLDLIGRQQRLAGLGIDGRGGEIVERRAGKGMRALAAIDGMAATVLHAQQLLAPFVEFVIADRGDLKAHHRQCLDGRFVMKQRGEKRAGADQVARGHEYAVRFAGAELLDQRRHMLGAAGGHGDLLRPVGGIVDTDTAGGRAQIAVEVVDGKDGDVDGGGGCLGVGTRKAQRPCREHRKYDGLNLSPCFTGRGRIALAIRVRGGARALPFGRAIGSHDFEHLVSMIEDLASQCDSDVIR
jgi:hypothetical protein